MFTFSVLHFNQIPLNVGITHSAKFVHPFNINEMILPKIKYQDRAFSKNRPIEVNELLKTTIEV